MINLNSNSYLNLIQNEETKNQLTVGDYYAHPKNMLQVAASIKSQAVVSKIQKLENLPI